MAQRIQERVEDILHPEKFAGFKNLTKPEDMPFDKAIKLIMGDVMDVWSDPDDAAYPFQFDEDF